MPAAARSIPTLLLALFAAAFGGMTLFAGGSVVLGPDQAREAAGNVVPLVVWFNFLAGFAYLVGAWAIWRGAPWARTLAWGIAGATAVVAAIFALKVAGGAAFEMRTVGALGLRVMVWVLIALGLGRWARA